MLISQRASVQSTLSIMGNYFKSILFFSSREAIWVIGQSAAPWEGVDGVCQSSDLQKDTDPSGASMRFITWHRNLTLSSGASICLLEFPFSRWRSKVRTKLLVFFFLRSLRCLIKIKRDSFISILTAMAELFLKPYYLLISSFFSNIVFCISNNKLDIIFTMAYISTVDVRAKACLLISKGGPREIKSTTGII